MGRRAPKLSTMASPLPSGKYTLTLRLKRFLGIRTAEKCEPSFRIPKALKSSYLWRLLPSDRPFLFRVYLILRGGRKVETRMATTLKMTRTRKVHQLKNTARTERAMPTAKRPIYHQVLWSLTMYSSASQEMSLCFTIS